MAVMVLDEDLERRLLAERERCDSDRWDEVWNGVYVVSPMPNDSHQDIVGTLSAILTLKVQLAGLGLVRPGVNVTDQIDDWTKNYRCPDVAVYLRGNPAQNRETNWLGGPDLAVEVVSPGEDPYAKLGFYADCGTREVLVVHRRPWRLELFRLEAGVLRPVGTSALAGDAPGAVIASAAVPFTWQLLPGDPRPGIEMTAVETGERWTI